MKYCDFVYWCALPLLMSCATPKEAERSEQPDRGASIGDPAFRDTVRNAFLNPNESEFSRRYVDAWSGNSAAIRYFFADALKQCQSSEIDAEAGMALTYTLQSLLSRLGDGRFESELKKENVITRAAVKFFLGDVSQYSKVQSLLNRTPAHDFPLLRAYRTA